MAFFQDNPGKPAPEKQNHSVKTNLVLLVSKFQKQYLQITAVFYISIRFSPNMTMYIVQVLKKGWYQYTWSSADNT